MITGMHIGSTLLSVIWIPLVGVLASAVTIAVSRRDGATRDSIINRVVMVWFSTAVVAVLLLTLQPGPNGFAAPRSSVLSPLSPIPQKDALSNVLLYLPVGFFGALWWRTKPQPIVWTVTFAAALSLTTEFAQLILPIDRAATTHDIVFNILGALVGAAAGTAIGHVTQPAREPRSVATRRRS